MTLHVPPAATPAALPADLIARFAAIVGERNAITAPDDQKPFLMDWRDLYRGVTPLVLRPGSTAEVAAVVSLANETGTAIVPQGGATGLVGGHLPDGSGREVVLSLTRLDRVREVDTAGNTMTLEAGVILEKAQGAAAAVDRLFPLSLGAEGSCTIGGNLATNAGGTGALAYGVARDLVVGLEVVLADGRIWHGLRKLKKDNTGYDLRHLFVGAEGTLGIITAAVVKLFPRPRAQEVAFLAVPDPEAALALYERATARAGSGVTGFEIMPRMGLDWVLAHGAGTRDPVADPHPWYVLVELSSQRATGLRDELEALFEEVVEAGIVTDGAVAETVEQARSFWRLRHLMSEVQKHEGGSIKHDVSVPVAAVPAFLRAATAAVEAMVPGCRPVPFGHLGDGNIHFNVSQPPGADKAAYLARWDEMNDLVHGIVARFGGSISAEHGIGRLKKELLPGVKDPVELDLMRMLKASFDPNGILNPGKVL